MNKNKRNHPFEQVNPPNQHLQPFSPTFHNGLFFKRYNLLDFINTIELMLVEG